MRIMLKCVQESVLVVSFLCHATLYVCVVKPHERASTVEFCKSSFRYTESICAINTYSIQKYHQKDNLCFVCRKWVENACFVYKRRSEMLA